MNQKHTEPKNLYERISSFYDSSKTKALLGAVALDTMLGNPSIAFAEEASRNATSSSNLGLGGGACLLGGVLLASSAIPKNKKVCEAMKYTGIGLVVAGCLSMFYK